MQTLGGKVESLEALGFVLVAVARHQAKTGRKTQPKNGLSNPQDPLRKKRCVACAVTPYARTKIYRIVDMAVDARSIRSASCAALSTTREQANPLTVHFVEPIGDPWDFRYSKKTLRFGVRRKKTQPWQTIRQPQCSR